MAHEYVNGLHPVINVLRDSVASVIFAFPVGKQVDSFGVDGRVAFKDEPHPVRIASDCVDHWGLSFHNGNEIEHADHFHNNQEPFRFPVATVMVRNGQHSKQHGDFYRPPDGHHHFVPHGDRNGHGLHTANHQLDARAEQVGHHVHLAVHNAHERVGVLIRRSQSQSIRNGFLDT